MTSLYSRVIQETRSSKSGINAYFPNSLTLKLIIMIDQYFTVVFGTSSQPVDATDFSEAILLATCSTLVAVGIHTC